MNGIIITAGLSSRMGELKALLKYNDKSFLLNIVIKLEKICSKIIIVTGYRKDEIENHISNFDQKYKSKIEIVYNPNYELGMFTSLKKGLQLCKSDWIIYHFIDQPNLPNEFYSDFINQKNKSYNWIQPINKGRKGHPILFDKKVVKKIIDSEDNSTLRIISKSNEINKYFYDCDYKEIFTDIDTTNDYEKLKREENEN
ncbi:MAG: nucleotidyltransferase family protein [Ignavibacteriales bacterium]|nr:nucleotidyltransferase family protein [Ignavibacteriales bacterium]MCB9260112.1 nucleotidyltransferase family protein [Ignavibacteriales bacterium]